MFGAEVKFFAECSSSIDYVQVHSKKIYGLESGENLNSCAGIFKQSMGAGNRAGAGLSYWPTRLHRLAELIPWNRFRGLLKSLKIGIDSFLQVQVSNGDAVLEDSI